MKKITFAFLSFLLFGSLVSQNGLTPSTLSGFDTEKAYQEAIKKGIPESDRKGWVEGYLKRDFNEKQHQHSEPGPIKSLEERKKLPSYSYDKNDGTMYVNLNPPHTQSVYCPNAGFENLDFSSWQPSALNLTGTISGNYTPNWNGPLSQGVTNTIPPGLSSTDQQCIMTQPAGNNNPGLGPLVGYDGIAINPTTGLAEIPVVAPTGGSVSVRLGNDATNYGTERIIYTMTINPQNAQFTYQYAVILQSPSGHPSGYQPFFKAVIKDSANNPLSGCGQYQVDALQAATDTAFKLITYLGEDLYYKKWTIVGVDLSAWMGQTLTIEFWTADCSYGGHFGYAYVDATCAILQGTVNGYCAGSSQVTLVAPGGFVGYEWNGPNNLVPIPGATNDSLVLNNPTLNDTFYVQMTSAAGCTTFLQTIIVPSTLQLQAISSTPTCPGGTSGTATAIATGGISLGYSYIWSSGAGMTGTIYDTSQTVTGLPLDTVFLHVESGNCPPKDSFVIVTQAPVLPVANNVTFCNTTLLLTAPSTGTNYQWYDYLNNALSPNGNNDSLTVLAPGNGQVWSIGFNDTATGCRDSIRFTLVASTFNVNAAPSSTCFGGSNGSVSFNATPGFGPYSYYVTGPGAFTNSGTTPSTLYIVNNLAPGTYTTTVSTPGCFDSLTFTVAVNPIPITNQTKNFCSGSFPLILTAPTGAGQNNYQWYDTTGTMIGGATNDSLTVSSPVNGNIYAFSYRDVNNCLDSVRITLNQSIFTVTALPANSCLGGATGQSTFNGPSGFGASTYTITGPNSYTSTATTGSTMYILNSLAPGTYTAVVTTPQGCYDSITVTIGQSPMPVSNVTKTFCASSVILVAPNTLGQNNYQWYNNLGMAIGGATGINDSLAVASPVTGNIYAVTFHNANGCSDSIRNMVNLVPLTSIPSTSPSCFGGTTGTVMATSTANGTSPFVYSVAGTASQSNTTALTSNTFSNLPAGTYTLTITSDGGACVYDTVLTITAGTVTTTLGFDSICPQDSTGLTSIVAGASHQWYSPSGVLIPGATGQTYNATPAVLGMYIDTVRSAQGCISVFHLSVSQIQFNSAVTSLTNNPCFHDSIGVITMGSTGGNGPYTYSWTGPQSFTGTGSTNNNLNSGLYTIISKSGNCKDTVLATIQEPPSPPDTLSIETTFCEGDTSAVLNAPPGFSNYQWYYNGVAIPNETDTSIFILNPSSSASHYTVTYLIPPCERKTVVIYTQTPPALFTPDITTNVFSPNGDNKNEYFQPYFNPLVSQAYIAYVSDGYNIKIYDRWGILVFESTDYSTQWTGKTKSGKECSDGTYFWTATYKSRCGSGDWTTQNGFVQLVR